MFALFNAVLCEATAHDYECAHFGCSNSRLGRAAPTPATTRRGEPGFNLIPSFNESIRSKRGQVDDAASGILLHLETRLVR